MAKGVKFLSVDDVLAIHDDTIANEGGSAGLRDPGLLVSAVLMPQQQFGGVFLHDDLGAMAAAYLFHIASNHPFIDGNKRAAAMSSLVFPDVNGVQTLPSSAEMADVTLRVASGQMGKSELTDWMRSQVGRIEVQ
jgi:death-on-curing protein